ncbi:insulinase family protein [Streptomyces roseoverticillatus]|uniref:M16 family metallopeptidase n=1 Tax=Streptomyces roseoverticillatus TaxID=66429 RepID=UPI001F318D6B|nr:insulinase family protein [Streptomyces roseoverticillatus]MCF3106792.1 insulinase family protein [Streptomyces roseoverticillatus]
MTPAPPVTPEIACVRTAEGVVVIGGHAEGTALSAVTLALPLAGAERAAVLAAPLLAACWARAVARTARRSGATVRTEPVVTADYAGVTVECVRSDHAVLCEVPQWCADGSAGLEPEFDAARTECLARLAADDRWSDGIRRALFGRSHRYGIGQDERTAFLTACGPEEAARLSGTLRASPPVLALSHTEPSALRHLAEAASATTIRRTARSTVRSSARPAGGPAEEPPGQPVRAVTFSAPAGPGLAYHLLGTPGVPLGSPDKAAVHLAWAVLGGREGLLDRRLRGERALTYSLAAFSREFGHAGYGMSVAGCAPEAIDEVAAETHAVITALADRGCKAALLASARERLVIQFLRAAQSGRSVTERLCGYGIAGVDPGESCRYPDRLAAVTPHDLRRAAGRYIAAHVGQEHFETTAEGEERTG